MHRSFKHSRHSAAEPNSPPAHHGPERDEEEGGCAAAPAELAPAAATDFSLELRAGEVNRANSDYLLELEHALDAISGHPVFHNMVAEEPRQITDSANETGFQCTFDNDLYNKAIASGTYTAGGNLFWLDLRWPATPWGAAASARGEEAVQHLVR